MDLQALTAKKRTLDGFGPCRRPWSKLETSAGGYQLFDEAVIDRCRRIQSLKARRLSLTEIRAAFEQP